MTNLLREIPENPIPEGIVSGLMMAKDGHEIRYARLATMAQHGTIVLLQGRNEAIEKYFEIMQDLAKLGYGSVTLDWRGQGGSSRLLSNPLIGHVRDFDSYIADLEQLFREIILPDCKPPFSILAHSTGALIALLAIPQVKSRVQRMVLTAPLLEFKERISQNRIRRFATLWWLLGMGSRYMPGARNRGKLRGFAGNQLSSDPMRFNRNLRLADTYPELTIGGPSAAWVKAASKAMEQVSDPAFMGANHIPILFLAAGSDEIVSTAAVERYARHLRSGHCLTIDGAKHELLQEADIFREQALAAFQAFIKGKGTEIEELGL